MFYWRNTEYFGGAGWLVGFEGWCYAQTRGILKIPKVTELAPKICGSDTNIFYTMSVEMGVLWEGVLL